MAAIPKYALDLIAKEKVHDGKLADLTKGIDDLRIKIDLAKDDLANVRGELAVTKLQLADQIKKTEEWDRRWWSILAIFVGAVLSLAAGLIVTLARK